MWAALIPLLVPLGEAVLGGLVTGGGAFLATHDWKAALMAALAGAAGKGLPQRITPTASTPAPVIPIK